MVFCCGLSNAVDYSEEDFRLPLFSLAYVSSFSFSFTATLVLQYIIAVHTVVIKYCEMYWNLTFVDPCIKVQFIKKIQQEAIKYQHFIIPYLCETRHVSGDTQPVVRSLKLHWQSLVLISGRLCGRIVGGRCQAQCAWQRPPNICPNNLPPMKNQRLPVQF